jgi:hypothetical protein
MLGAEGLKQERHVQAGRLRFLAGEDFKALRHAEIVRTAPILVTLSVVAGACRPQAITIGHVRHFAGHRRVINLRRKLRRTCESSND